MSRFPTIVLSNGFKMGLSPSTLFHFTSKKGLEGILQDNFKIKYCLEKLLNGTDESHVAIPMVSFCDIRISETLEHMDKYGKYGIGLSKEWAIKNGLSPVFYQVLNSEFSLNFGKTISNAKYADEESIFNTVIDLLKLSKEYEGKLIRNDKVINEKYRFSDEREWRFIPSRRSAPHLEDIVIDDEYRTPQQKSAANKQLNHLRLKFSANDIMYIIVKKEEEINDLIRHIRLVKGKHYTADDVDRLTIRILSYERIISDI